MASRDPPDLSPNNDTKRLKVESTEPDKVECRQLVADGDVMLVVGSKREMIQVSLHLLCTASPFFKAMLESDFKEGKALRERDGRPAEIELPTESPEAV
ncbi:BTB domain-containing protein [Fusarium sp. LHS14.1]|nr:BTB domain-containing protein [Fusarium sp. LHS14.1]